MSVTQQLSQCTAKSSNDKVGNSDDDSNDDFYDHYHHHHHHHHYHHSHSGCHIISRLDYCNAVLHCAPDSSIQKLQLIQNTAARIVLQAPRQSPSRPLLERLHWLPVRQRIDYNLAILTYKIWHTSTPAYLSHHIRPRESTRHLRSSFTPLLHKPTTRTRFADRAFRCSAPAVWNSLNIDTLCCSSLALFKRSLKTFLFRRTFRPSYSCITRL